MRAGCQKSQCAQLRSLPSTYFIDLSGSTFTTIPGMALRPSNNLISITIPNSVNSIERFALSDGALRGITFLKAGITIADDLFGWGGDNPDRNSLKTAYESGGVGTYVKAFVGITWTKQN